MAVNIEPSKHGTPRSPLTDHTQYQESLSLKVIDGTWPTDLNGHVFFTSPDVRTGVPLFGSDGMLYRFDLTERGILVRSSSTRTPSSVAEEVIARSSLSKSLHAFRQIGLSRLSPLLGAVECLNVSPVFVAGRLWVTSDTGRPWEVDPATLRLLGPVGGRDDWKGVAPLPWCFPLWLTSGHPAVDPDGTAWGANFSNMASPGQAAFFRLMRIHEGHIQPIAVLDAATGEPAPIHQSVHQMISTERFIVVLDSAFHVETRQLIVGAIRSAIPFPERMFAGLETEAQSDKAVFWIIDRADIRPDSTSVPARRVSLEGEATHFAADWTNPEGVIRIVVLHTPCQDVSEWIRKGERMANGRVAHPDLIGLPAGMPMAQGSVGEHRLFPDGRVESKVHQHDPYTWGPALFTLPPDATPTVDHFWYYTAGLTTDALPERLVNTYAHRLGEEEFARLAKEGRPHSLVQLDLKTGKFHGWNTPAGWGIFGLCFCPREGAADPWDGYLFACALSDAHEGLPADSKGDEIWIFRALDVQAGPICRLAHRDFNLPFTLHSAYTRRIQQRHPAFRVDLTADTDPATSLEAWCDHQVQTSWLGRPMALAARMAMDVPGVTKILQEQVLPRFRR